MTRHLLAALMIALVLVNVAAAAGRYLRLFTWPWADELMLFGMIWGVALGAFLVTLRRGHLAMDLVIARLPRALRRALEILVAVVTVALLGYVMVQSASFISTLISVDQRSMAAQAPMWVAHIAVPTSFGLMIAAACARAYVALAGGELATDAVVPEAS